MKIIIHRGAHQIGGCITEIKSDDAKILLILVLICQVITQKNWVR